ncbi:hypothetical protein ABZX30_37955, partial [Streptomyces sp. NPDC004542]|uniref:hypothetical protein n=1 Tax=Streptomyces sp. NPDC004542 TaxID=3154281 RepID=UPI0033BF4E81
MSAPAHKRRWLTICAIAASAGLLALPASAAPGRGHGSPFGVRTEASVDVSAWPCGPEDAA